MGGNAHVSPHEALTASILGKLDPGGDWRNQVPASGWATGARGGSSNIPFMATVALLAFGSDSDKKRAESLLQEYVNSARSGGRYWIIEQFSNVYAAWILGCIVQTTILSRRRGNQSLAAGMMELLLQWLAVADLMAARVVRMPQYGSAPGEEKYIGAVVTLFAGQRCWGHGLGLAFGHHAFYRMACGLTWRGDVHAGGWLSSPEFCGVLKEAWRTVESSADKWQFIKFGCRVPFTIYRFADDSRVMTLGYDEASVHDEDLNSNTMGWLWAGVVGGVPSVYPEWPNPRNGDERIRQTAVLADLDGDPQRGWMLLHSEVGRVKAGNGWLTNIPAVKSALVEARRLEQDGTLVNLMVSSEPDPQLPPDPQPEPATGSDASRSIWQRIVDWLRSLL